MMSEKENVRVQGGGAKYINARLLDVPWWFWAGVLAIGAMALR